jgi:serine/threonine protein phosphatase PrpC
MSTDRKPRDEEIDVYGLTDQGKVRKDNQDHFLIASVHRRLHVLQTSLTDPTRVPMADDRVAFLAMVADGVGGGVGGQEASATALETATEYIASSSKCFMEGDAAGTEFIETLQAAAHRSHEAVKARAMDIAPGRSMATTLTMYIGVWPYYYLLQVGDSRYYLFRGDTLTQVSRDQTIAQDLVDQGVLTRAVAERSRFNDVLSSAIGADEAVPVVTRLKSEWGMVHLLCTDGLIKHVTDARIKEVLATMTSSRQACETLVGEALANGGSDNVTVIVGRALKRD